MIRLRDQYLIDPLKIVWAEKEQFGVDPQPMGYSEMHYRIRLGLSCGKKFSVYYGQDCDKRDEEFDTISEYPHSTIPRHSAFTKA